MDTHFKSSAKAEKYDKKVCIVVNGEENVTLIRQCEMSKLID